MSEPDITAWVGRTTRVTDTIDARTVAQLAATLDRTDIMLAPDKHPLPPCWHWAFFQAPAAQSRLGSDGHAERGDFLPPVTLPRRMWAGSRLVWHGGFAVGQRVERQSTILKVTPREGRTGRMVFVTVGHEHRVDGQNVLSEEHDIVYRDDPGDAERAALTTVAQRIASHDHAFEEAGASQRLVNADAVMMFRYSAVTFNGHRIHYDRRYCESVEHYPGLVVHGPLIATLLVGWAGFDLHPGHRVTGFSFRAQRPTFDLAPFHLHADDAVSAPEGTGKSVRVWSSNNVGETAVVGEVQLA